ncbi:Uncharacterised protein [Klebsiella pneumoniae subsp. ozaenae]|uniref:Uncharacterized protein n=1 Tax=Klebsiella pneumoniae subsp. ozaenae TaxID=574 RepID=A0A378B1J3_KLEPO|nr:Uncharacterised protein [Klebsiella pneumoniae subsp. ozaenae]
MGASHGEKDPRHPRQQLTTLLQRLERVGETGRLRIVDNSANFGPLLPDAPHQTPGDSGCRQSHRTAAPGKATY